MRMWVRCEREERESYVAAMTSLCWEHLTADTHKRLQRLSENLQHLHIIFSRKITPSKINESGNFFNIQV